MNQYYSFLQLSKATTLLNEAQQPYNYLIESIRARDSQNQSLNEQLALMEEETRLFYNIMANKLLFNFGAKVQHRFIIFIYVI